MISKHLFESQHAINKLASTEPYRNRVLAESESFVAIPTVGALVEGWLLIVPRRPSLSVGALPQKLRTELNYFCEEVATLLNEHYGPIALFEHGPATTQTEVGCGVDYAHVHLVPFRENLLKLTAEMFPLLDWRNTNGFSDCAKLHAAGKSYWYVNQPEYLEQPQIGTCENITPSQMFRKVIAKSLGRYGEYDWKSSPSVDLMKKTCQRLSNVFA